jgi:hypothetical protein
MSRKAPDTLRCKLCRKILVNNIWMHERREFFVNYRGSVCSHCVELPGHKPERQLPRAGQTRGSL